ncbi:recombinase family protein [Roseobacter sp.]|uniref:recombinase family protein n=1 Tax=Roseobacter sp. TaxID=1907202 RepID=UPI0029668517|nr:recombinase family protein [Roseobacter sp.]MDW3181643.1 recombinase family protein [Roseobacter sp.]
MIDACLMAFECQTEGMKDAKIEKKESKQNDIGKDLPMLPKGRKIGYVRVSDADQSEALQMDALKAEGCVTIYCDHGVSGVRTARPALDQMMTQLKAGDTLTVWKLDRLGRSTIHLLQILNDLSGRGIHFHTITQGIDTSTAVGRMIFGQLAVFAEYERSLISERTKAGMKAAKQRGVHVGRPKMSKVMGTALEELEQVDCAYGLSNEELGGRITDSADAMFLDNDNKTKH